MFDGESKEIFRHAGQFIPEAAERSAVIEFLDSIKARTDEVYLQVSEFRGHIFNVEVDGGSRTYYLENETEIDPWRSKLVVFAGVVMAMFGLIGIILERKLSRHQ